MTVPLLVSALLVRGPNVLVTHPDTDEQDSQTDQPQAGRVQKDRVSTDFGPNRQAGVPEAEDGSRERETVRKKETQTNFLIFVCACRCGAELWPIKRLTVGTKKTKTPDLEPILGILFFPMLVGPGPSYGPKNVQIKGKQTKI